MTEEEKVELQTKRVISLVGGVIINGENIVGLDAKVSSDGVTPTKYSEHITNSELYYKNREESRRQINEFRKTVYDLEDEFVLSVQNEEVEPETELELEVEEIQTEEPKTAEE